MEINKELIEREIERLILMRRMADKETEKKINAQLDKLYQWKYELMK